MKSSFPDPMSEELLSSEEFNNKLDSFEKRIARDRHSQNNRMAVSLGNIVDEIVVIKHTLHGPRGDNGMYKDVRELKAWRRWLELRLVAIIALLVRGPDLWRWITDLTQFP